MTTKGIPSVPDVPASLTLSDVQRIIDPLARIISIRQGQFDPLDRWVTQQDLINAGLQTTEAVESPVVIETPVSNYPFTLSGDIAGGPTTMGTGNPTDMDTSINLPNVVVIDGGDSTSTFPGETTGPYGVVEFSLESRDEGIQVVADTKIIDFVGAGVTVTNPSGDQIRVDIPGGGGGGGDVTKVGTPVDDQVGVWTGDGTIEGTTAFTFDGTELVVGNYTLDTNQVVGAAEDDYVLTYDDGTGQISLEPAPAAAAAGNINTIQYHDSGGILGGLAGFTVNDIATTTGYVGVTSQSGLTAGDLFSVYNNQSGKTAQVMRILQDQAGSSADGLLIDVRGTGDALVVTQGAGIDFSAGGQLQTAASTTARAGLNIPEGTAPTTPADGDVWVTAAGAFNARLNGSTVDLSSGSGGGSTTTVENEVARSGATDDFTGLTDAKWVEIYIEDYDVDGVNDIWFRPLYSTSTVQTTGYASHDISDDGTTIVSNTATDTFKINPTQTASVIQGVVRFTKSDDNTEDWVAHGEFWDTTNDAHHKIFGKVSMTGALTGIRISNSAASTFDTGNVYCIWGD